MRGTSIPGKRHLPLIILALLLSLVSCQGTRSLSTPPVADTLAPTFAVPADAPITSTLLSATATIIIPTPTWTQPPKLDSDTRYERIQQLMETNGGCSLPCWWGITPGITTLSEARSFILPMVTDCGCSTDEWGINDAIELSFLVPGEHSVEGSIRMIVHFSEGILQTIKIDESNWFEYRISEVLENYGLPDEIWVHTIPDFPGPKPPISLFLFYQEQGILLYYYSLDDDITVLEHTLKGCFSLGAGGIYLWSPKENLSIKEVGELFGQTIITYEGYDPILPLEEIINESVEDFYDHYKGISDEKICLEIALPDVEE